MKKVILSIVLFVVALAGTYLALSVAVPELANPAISSAEHFLAESLQYKVVPKLLFSLPVAGFMAMAPRLYRKPGQSEE